ncbi:hypothetical protein HK405_000197 [Cladochytrium tenue]|nr:hypothetical protein HK405_000197 [Cladochytrium tenue]
MSLASYAQGIDDPLIIFAWKTASGTIDRVDATSLPAESPLLDDILSVAERYICNPVLAAKPKRFLAMFRLYLEWIEPAMKLAWLQSTMRPNAFKCIAYFAQRLCLALLRLPAAAQPQTYSLYAGVASLLGKAVTPPPPLHARDHLHGNDPRVAAWAELLATPVPPPPLPESTVPLEGGADPAATASPAAPFALFVVALQVLATEQPAAPALLEPLLRGWATDTGCGSSGSNPLMLADTLDPDMAAARVGPAGRVLFDEAVLGIAWLCRGATVASEAAAVAATSWIGRSFLACRSVVARVLLADVLRLLMGK